MIYHGTSIQMPLGTFAWTGDGSRLFTTVMIKNFSI